MLFDNLVFSELIPQSWPMVMVDGLLDHNENYTESTFTITDDNIFVSGGIFSETGIIENIAQTAALRSGYQAFMNKFSPDIGFIGSVRNLFIHRLPTTGETIITRVELVSELIGALVVRGITKIDDEVIAEGQLNIFIQKNKNEKN